MTGCSQLAWQSPTGALLIRNYDYDPRWFEGVLFHTHWLRPVIGFSDCAWGLLDSMNGDGLCASLTFGGSRATDTGFAITLLIATCSKPVKTVAQAVEAFRRIPVHMAYNVSLVDAHGDHRVLHLHPGGGLTELHQRVCANHQTKVAWPEYEKLTATRERHAHLEFLVEQPEQSRANLVRSFLSDPSINRTFSAPLEPCIPACGIPIKGTFTYTGRARYCARAFDHFEAQTFRIRLQPEYS